MDWIVSVEVMETTQARRLAWSDKGRIACRVKGFRQEMSCIALRLICGDGAAQDRYSQNEMETYHQNAM